MGARARRSRQRGMGSICSRTAHHPRARRTELGAPSDQARPRTVQSRARCRGRARAARCASALRGRCAHVLSRGDTSYGRSAAELALYTKSLDITGRVSSNQWRDARSHRPADPFARCSTCRRNASNAIPTIFPSGHAHREFGRIAVAAEDRVLDGLVVRALASGECHHTGATDCHVRRARAHGARRCSNSARGACACSANLGRTIRRADPRRSVRRGQHGAWQTRTSRPKRATPPTSGFAFRPSGVRSSRGPSSMGSCSRIGSMGSLPTSARARDT